jgi:hypothetical protein
MKITQLDYDCLKNALVEVKDRIPAHIEYLNKPENKAKIKNFDTRLRWDWFFFALKKQDSRNFLDKLYDYLDDSHIDTALKSIIKEIVY